VNLEQFSRQNAKDRKSKRCLLCWVGTNPENRSHSLSALHSK